MKSGLELYKGHPAGRDPRDMTTDELRAAGHDPMSPLDALRARCLECCGDQANEVALCAAVECPSWPFRMGTNPWRRPASETGREAARRTMTRLNARRRKQGGIDPAVSFLDRGIAPPSAEGSEASPTSVTARFDRVPKSESHRGEGEGPEERNDAQGAGVPAAGVVR